MKKLLIVAIIVLAIAGGVFYYLHKNKLKDFEPQIKEKLSQLVKDASNGLYNLDIGKLEADVVTSRITLINAHLRPDTLVYDQLEKSQSAPNELFDITISELSLDDVVPSEFLVNKGINLRTLFIDNPVISVLHKKRSYNVPEPDPLNTIFQKIKKDVSSIKVDTILLRNIDFTYTNASLNNKVTRLANLKLFFSDVLLDSTTQFDKQRFLFAKNCVISLKDYSLNTSDSLYKFKVGDIEIQTIDKAMQLKKLQFLPRVGPEAFYKNVKHQQDRFDVAIDQVKFNKVDWWSIMSEESFLVQKVSLSNGKIKIFNDKSQPIDQRSKVGKYPHQLLMKLPFRLKVDSFLLNNLDLSYTELNPKSNETGTLTFDDINGHITNITNDPAQIRNNHFVNIMAQALFMKKSPLKAHFMLDLLNYKRGDFAVTASLGALQASQINLITVPLGMLKVNSLNVKSLDVSMKGDNNKGSATVKMIYDDLNVTALKQADDTLKKRPLISFIANTFVIKKENPSGNKPIRVENGFFERDIHRSFFNLVWKTIFTGAGKTAGYKVKK